MTPASPYRLRRTADELYQRSVDGAAYYAVGSVLVVAAGERAWSDYPAHWAAALVYLLLWWLRRRGQVPVADAALPGWIRQRFVLFHIGALIWSGVMLLTLWQDGHRSNAMLVAVISTAAFGTATAALLAPVPKQAGLALALLLVPSVLATLWLPDSRVTGLTMVIFGLYLAGYCRRSARFFHAQLNLEEALHASRAEVESLTLQDALTRLANRRAYDLQAPQSWEQSHRRRAPLSLVMADIDHFKQVNDQHGHAAGDACLRHFAALLRQHFRRAGDLQVRLGGEEFVVLLADCTLHDATERTESFRALLEATLALHEGKSLAFTASFGVAQAHWDGHDHPDQFLARADAALYRAKHGGRNRVEPELRE